MKKFRNIIVALLCIGLIAALLSGCGGNVDELMDALATYEQSDNNGETTVEETTEAEVNTEETTVVEAETESESEKQTEEASKDNSENISTDELLTVKHYDPTDFLEACETLEEYAESGRIDEMNDLYDELYEEVARVEDYYTASNIIYNEDVTNTDNKEENEYLYGVAVDCEDAFCTAVHNILNGNAKDEMKEHINDDRMYDDFMDYEVLTSDQKELLNQETELSNDYLELADSFEYYDALENEKAGEIYVKLVKIRDELAKSFGYDNYNQYADEKIFYRDYSEEDLENMKEAVKEFGNKYEFAYYMLYSQLQDINETTDEYIENVGNILSGISPLVDSAWKYFTEYDRYSIGSESVRQDGAYTTTFNGTGIPFIFAKLSGGQDDYTTLPHEFGHFTDAYINVNKYWLMEGGSYDLFEIHSNGLELLANANLDSYVQNADVLKRFNVAFIISNITDGCMYDDFQRQVYENPDWTLDEINACFKQTMKDYGHTEYEGMEYFWIAVPHNFVSPDYYISYATSAYAALQIWELSQTDYAKAVETWEKVISAGAYDDGYMTIVKDAGLSLFTDSDKVTEALDNAYSYISAGMNIYSVIDGFAGGFDSEDSYGSGADSNQGYLPGNNGQDSSQGYMPGGNSSGNDIFGGSNYDQGGSSYYYYDIDYDEMYEKDLEDFFNQFMK